ncbi:MAG: hypothetical protein GF398_02390 [Chitinivibrionales bacterium]|nr:hypothetical protein [Chitinivibrionales bacterium]
MKSRLLEHVLSTVIVTVLLIGVLVISGNRREQQKAEALASIKPYINSPEIDLNSPFGKALFKETLNIYFAGQADSAQAVYNAVMAYKDRQFGAMIQSAHVQDELDSAKLKELAGMYVKFVLVYLLVMALAYYGVQTLGTWQFVRRKTRAEKKGQSSPFTTIAGRLSSVAASFILFSPAYVIAYSIRTEFRTDTTIFLVLLALISNGLLITYAHKFYSFLKSESRKGYVYTALVKNLAGTYNPTSKDGIRLSAILRPAKKFDGHVLGHIYENARHQYLSTIKEQASFLITGLIIIEMALNIHGHLSYEMLRQILYKNYDIVIAIILGIFYTVKATEIFADAMIHRELRKYAN